MNRRNTIKTLMMASAGLAALPAWANGWSQQRLDLTGIRAFLDPEEEAILTAVSDTILPAGDTIGALDVNVPAFLFKLFADCYEPEVQQNIQLQCRALQASALGTYTQSFVACTQQERETLLLALASSEVPAQNEFFELVKRETIRGFLTSRKVLQDHFEYVVAPGFYHGCVDIST